MGGCLKGCLTTVGLVVVTLAVAYAGWRWGGPVFPVIEEAVGIEGAPVPRAVEEPSPELAQITLDRVRALQQGVEGDHLRLGGPELSSVLRYGAPGIVPPGVDEPAVTLRDGNVTLSARVALDAFPDLPGLEDVVGLLPDTVDLTMRGMLLPFGERQAAFHVERIEASRVPLPARLVPGILRALGRRDREGLPASALLVPLPEGLASAYVEADELVLVADR